MSESFSDRSAPILIVGGTAASYAAGWLIGVPVLVPALNTLAAFPFMFVSLRRGSVAQAVARMIIWAAAMGAFATLFAYGRPAEAARLFIHGDAYRRDMFAWILTGIGAESDPTRFVPEHLAHLAIFCALSLTSGSILSMPMGAVLMNYMATYVGGLAARSTRPALAALVGWHPWSLLRIASYVVIGVVLAGPVLSRVGGFKFRLPDHTRLLAIAASGVVLDIVLKWLLAPTWRGVLRSVVGW